MKILTGDMWDYKNIVVPTNGSLNQYGENTMGAGIALVAKNLYFDLPALVGNHLSNNGNVVGRFEMDDRRTIYTVPTKPTYSNESNRLPRYAHLTGEQPGWMAKSDIGLIHCSLVELIKVNSLFLNEPVAIPLLGVGNGGLPKYAVMELMQSVLPDNFTLFLI